MRILIMLLIFCVACGSEDSPIVLDESGTLRATISGSEQVAPEVDVTMRKSSFQVSNELAFLADFKGTTTGISFTVSTNNLNVALQKGEFVAKGNNPPISPSYFFYFPNDGSGAFMSTNVAQEIAGIVTITDLDVVNKTVSGTFDMKVKRNTETLQLTKGSFTKLVYKE